MIVYDAILPYIILYHTAVFLHGDLAVILRETSRSGLASLEFVSAMLPHTCHLL